MPHRNVHRHGAGKIESGGGGRRTEKKEQQVTTEKMSQEFPTYEALDESRAGLSGGAGARGEHRVDPARMSKAMKGASGTSVRRPSDTDTGLSHGEGDTSEDFAARDESARPLDSGGALSEEGDVSLRGESTRASDAGLSWGGPDRSVSESTASPPQATGSVDQSSRPARDTEGGASPDTTARGGFIEPDERTSGSSARH